MLDFDGDGRCMVAGLLPVLGDDRGASRAVVSLKKSVRQVQENE